jgi:DNA-binding NarL/FixJ family response regulator
MFKKVLIVEDLDSVAYGIAMMLVNELEVESVVQEQYCNEAYLKFRKAAESDAPFDLLITDLSFIKDHRETNLDSGLQLVRKLRGQGYKVPIVICSVEERPGTIKQLLEQYGIAAYVLKGRHGLKDLKMAVEAAYKGDRFFSRSVANALKKSPNFEILEYDIYLLDHLSKGMSQNEISEVFSYAGIRPSSVSSIEKRINKLKDLLKASNNVQLVVNAKDLGII